MWPICVFIHYLNCLIVILLFLSFSLIYQLIILYCFVYNTLSGFSFHWLLVILLPPGAVMRGTDRFERVWTAATVNNLCLSYLIKKLKLYLIFYPHYYYLTADGDCGRCTLFTYLSQLLNQVFICVIQTWWTWWGSWWSPTRSGNGLPRWTRWEDLWD